MRRLGHLARVEERRSVYRVLVVKPEERDHLEDLVVYGRITYRWIIRKWDVGLWTGSRWFRIVRGGGHL